MPIEEGIETGSAGAVTAMFAEWLADVFSCPAGLTLLSIVAKSAVIYLFVVAGMRLLGTRELGRLNAYDFVLVVVIANAVQNALVGGDTTLVGGPLSRRSPCWQ